MKPLVEIKDSCQGERVFIIGNGPSLRETKLKPLKDEFTIGLNRIYLNYENMGFYPSFYCAVNPFVIKQFGSEIDRVDAVKFLRKGCEDYIRNQSNVYFMQSAGVHDFNMHIEEMAWAEGFTVTYCAMQVAYFLGFETVILLGVDHSFSNAGDPNKTVTAKGPDPNHFHPDYFGKGTQWQYPDLEGSEISYRIARRVFEKDGRRIYDATIGGKLDVFPKVDYQDFLMPG
jgi:hypothetical protein